MGQPADARSDIYSIGVMAFEALTGVLPFTADSVLAIAMKHVSERVPDNLNLYKDISPALRAVVLRALEKDPLDRFASAAELDAALGEAEKAPLVAPAPARAPAAPPAPKPPPPAPRGDIHSTQPLLGFEDNQGGKGPARTLAIDMVTPRVPYRRRSARSAPEVAAAAAAAARAPAAPQAPPPQPAPPPSPPAQPEPPAAQGPPRTLQSGFSAGTAPRQTRPPNVFLVETDGAERLSTAAELQKSGCRAIDARSAEEALDVLMRHPVDILVTDLALPGMDGFELVRILRRQPSFAQLPILLLTPRPNKSQETFAAQLGITEVQPRPFDPSQLVGKTWRLLAPLGFFRDGRAGPPTSGSTSARKPGS
jgi:CheY-like chemotaxis protein